MASTLTSFRYHIVFSTKHRNPLIHRSLEPELHAYMGGIIKSVRGVPLQIGGTEDHVHIYMGLPASIAVSDVLREVKSSSSRWVNQTKGPCGLEWQTGYGGFSVSRSIHDTTIKYIQNQHVHHKTKTFQQEFLEILKENDMAYEEQYLWD